MAPCSTNVAVTCAIIAATMVKRNIVVLSAPLWAIVSPTSVSLHSSVGSCGAKESDGLLGSYGRLNGNTVALLPLYERRDNFDKEDIHVYVRWWRRAGRP